ncbi:MAG: hypothetical protein AAGB12_16065 [Pseudomonadota bacterium]
MTKPIFENFTDALTPQDSIPEEAIKSFNPEIWQRFCDGNAAFFEPLKSQFPRLFTVLTDEKTSPIYLLEDKSRNLMTDKVTYSYHMWGLKHGENELKMLVNHTSLNGLKKILYYQEFIDSIPKGFECFLDVAESFQFSHPNQSFQAVFAKFLSPHELSSLYYDMELPPTQAERVAVAFPDQLFHVLLENFHQENYQKDMVFFDDTGRSPHLYGVKAGHYDQPFVMMNPIEHIDKFLADSLQGKEVKLFS